MKTFKQFLNESRTRVVDIKSLTDWADKNAQSYLKGTTFLYRGGSGEMRGVKVGTSEGGEPRKSANINNNYTLWMDNHPSFKGWPQRSQSWICTDDMQTASGFGSVSILVVADTARAGIVGEADLWYIEVFPKKDVTIDEWTGMTESVLHALWQGDNESYSGLKSALQYATLERMQKYVDRDPNGDDVNHKAYAIERSYVQDMVKLLTELKVDSLYEAWDKYFVPKLFVGKTNGAKLSSTMIEGEVWVQGECGFIPYYAPYLKEEEKEELLEWAKKYPNFRKTLISSWADTDE